MNATTEHHTADQERLEQGVGHAEILEAPEPTESDHGDTGKLPPIEPPTDRNRRRDRPERPPGWYRLMLWGTLLMLIGALLGFIGSVLRPRDE